MKTIRSNEIDLYSESIGDQVLQVDKCQHADRPVKFHNKIEVTLLCLVFP